MSVILSGSLCETNIQGHDQLIPGLADSLRAHFSQSVDQKFKKNVKKPDVCLQCCVLISEKKIE